MYALVIGRAFPDEKTGMMGIFEFEQAVALQKAGVKTVYAFCDTRSVKSLRQFNYKEFTENNVPVYGYHFPIGGIPQRIFDKIKTNRTIKILKKILKDHGTPDVIHVHFPLLNLNTEIWNFLKSLNRTIVITEHWSKVQTKKIEEFRKNLLKLIVDESDAFICVGELLKKSVQKLTNTNKEIKIIPNMLNENFYFKDKEVSENFRFVTMGRLVDAKRVGFLIEAFAKAFPDNNHIKLDIAGDGPLFEKLKKQINTLNMNDRIKLHGFLPRTEIADLVRESDAFVSASVLETFGVPFIEAMACGKPVIGIENGPIDSYINNTNGMLFKQDDLSDLIRVLQTMYENKLEFDRPMIAKATVIAFGEKAIANQLKKIYKQEDKIGG